MASLLLAVIYLSFISLGLPDALLGAAWPTMSQDLGAPVSWAGGISMTISAATICSALMSDRVTLRFGAGRVTAVSVGLTAAALMGFSIAPNYWTLIALAIPYGLGAGGVDAALNNYVAIHYESRHMSWLHCMWGVGALTGPYVMGYALSHGQGWPWGYRYIGFIQIALTAIVIISLPLWKARRRPQTTVSTAASDTNDEPRKPLGVRGVVAIKGASEILLMFLCYCAIESTCMLWGSTYMVMGHGIGKAEAASWISLFFIGITVGRALSGFLTMRLADHQMIRLGQALILAGIVIMLLPLPHHIGVFAGLTIIGLGCAPVYPCIIHSTPVYFGEENSQAIVGVQMACAYVGTMLMPPLFGLIAQYVTVDLFPCFLLVFLALMVAMHESLRRKRG
ncbi:MFS transporter [Bifidobacterium sp. UTCIF-37]|uniref:MFS transporter n=1 Tax=unclassified Bifidobacterium TaxID=2608897 RepID=UPI0011291542|nr:MULTISPECIES: MFS transporter [unclassified Bifidobacterium]TPF86706.1 MFS transporter [Bifidobacterium sp. UTCIF-37]TPF89849.1 MFS transporter [Bifidobacterium sp. UTCIF-38]